ncbi:DNA/RNA non-specific endonuclease [Cohnella lupini]|uniref:DNA/RNA non-specific endonuclease n=1 Tax=Cohnella lupini TaxID=1294267 RepID=A0A3D9HQ93_9BACL|nr:DNA/RNA non-specific endonuclease [Cohnella lupini]
MKKIISIFIACIIITLVGCAVDSNGHEDEAKTPSSSSISTKAENNASASEVTEASGISSGRNVSGFTKSNKTITWSGIDFSFPSYFDVLDKGSTENLMHYYPEEKDYYASILFQSKDFSGTQEDFNSSIPSIVKSTLEAGKIANSDIQKSEKTTIAGLPGWTITYTRPGTEGDGVTSTTSYSFAYNIDAKKVVMISCTYDSNDKSKYDYLGDYKKVLKTAKMSTKPSNELFSGYKHIEVDGCDLSGHREPNVVVDVGYGDREYWAFTNEHGQLVRVIADEIILQDDSKESLSSSGRYCSDEAKVPGVESDVLDEGHVIADSLGGASNAYNITPQDSTLNRHGDQAYMEDAIRKAGVANNFEAIITYRNTETQIPSSYQYTYTLMGNVIVDTFDNVNPDEVNSSLGLTGSEPSDSTSSEDLSGVDTNGNGKVTIKEAKAAGYSMPITSDHWLYKYMDDRDGDGMVGE